MRSVTKIMCGVFGVNEKSVKSVKGVWATYEVCVRSVYLGISQHYILDEWEPTCFAVLHPHIVHLVSTDLAMLAPGQQRAPHHL